jgi:hypothetical protein
MEAIRVFLLPFVVLKDEQFFSFSKQSFFQVYTENRKFPKNICHHNAKKFQKKPFWSQYVKQRV